MRQYPRYSNLVSLTAGKGGVGKTAGSLNVATAAALSDPDRQVIVLALDSNDSAHDRIVQPHHRTEGETDALLARLIPPALPDAMRINHLLDGRPITPERLDAHLYRRDDLPNLGVLFHTAGTLIELTVQYLHNQKFRDRYSDLLQLLSATADLVIVDTPADTEALLVSETLKHCGVVIAASDLSSGGVRSTVVLADMALDQDIPLLGVVVSPDDYSNSSVLQQSRRDLERFSQLLDVDLLPIPQDATVGKAERYATPVPLLVRDRSDELRLSDRANHGYTAAARWLWSIVNNPEEIDRRWIATQQAADRLRATERLRARQATNTSGVTPVTADLGS